jgi:hypothetical protein
MIELRLEFIKKLCCRECKRISVIRIEPKFNGKTIPKSMHSVTVRSVG